MKILKAEFIKGAVWPAQHPLGTMPEIAIIISGLTPAMKRLMRDRIADIEVEHLRYLFTLI